MASRDSIDSAGSAAPLISAPSFHQPPPPPRSKYHENHGNVVGNGNNTATKVHIAAVIVACRILALIAGLAIGVSFALLGEAWRGVTISLIVLTWVSVAWNALMIVSLISFIRRPSLRVSLVLSDGKVINLGSQGEGDGGENRTCFPPFAFWIDLLLVTAVMGLTIAEHVTGDRYHRTTTGLNWFTITFNLIVTLLTMFPALVTAHVRFETVEMPQIALP
ncbi:hypothetical protein F5Y10DRAFT_102140 [Nemania abortiva]|nr:hypothetical protein F5Y10DRAFT_102140 [Nemania abortiva]